MTDKKYNDIFDLKGIKTCSQVREEKLKEKQEGNNV